MNKESGNQGECQATHGEGVCELNEDKKQANRREKTYGRKEDRKDRRDGINNNMEVKVDQKWREEDKVAYNSSPCPNVTLSWRRVHLPCAVLVKGNQARREDYLKPEVEVKPNRHSQ